MKTIITTAFKWFPALLGLLLIGAIVWGVIDCRNTKANNVLLVADTTAKGLKMALYRNKIDTLEGSVSFLKRTLTKADSNFQAAQVKHKKQLSQIQNFVASISAEQQKDTILKIIRVPFTPADSAKPMVSYTPDQNKAIAEEIISAQQLKEQRVTVDQLQATQEARIELIGVRIKEAIAAEKKRKHFLGIGQKKGLESLQKTTDYVIETTY